MTKSLRLNSSIIRRLRLTSSFGREVEVTLRSYERQVLFSFERLSVNFLAIYDKMGVSQKMTHRIQF